MKRIDVALAFGIVGFLFSELVHGNLPTYGYIVLYCVLAFGAISLIDFKSDKPDQKNNPKDEIKT